MKNGISNSKNQSRLILRWMLLAFVVALGSCKGPEESGELSFAVSGENFILIDAKATSCKSRNSTTPTEDVNSLYLDLGKFSITWTPTVANARLKVIYIRVTPRSGGLSSSDAKVIGGQDLNCLMSASGNIDQSPIVTGGAAGTPVVFPFPQGHILGDFSPTDSTKRTSFRGRADVLVYALLQIDGQSDVPLTARTSFNFQFDGI